MGERQRQWQAQRQVTDKGCLRGRALDHIDDPWTKNWEDKYIQSRIDMEVGLSLYLLGGILAQDRCCLFRRAARGAGAAQSSRQETRCGERQ